MNLEGLLELPDDEYRARLDHVSNSELNEFAISPAHYKRAYLLEKKRAKSPAMTLGTYVHLAILEPEKFDNEATFIDTKILNRVEAIRAAVVNSKSAMALLSKDCVFERCAFWKDPDTGVACKGKLDVISPDGFVADLKTTSSIAEFQKSIDVFNYHRQAAFYLDGLSEVTGLEFLAYYFIVVETKPPWLVQIFELEPLSIEEGQLEYKELLANFRECKAANHWPGLPDRILPIGLPEHRLIKVRQRDEARVTGEIIH